MLTFVIGVELVTSEEVVVEAAGIVEVGEIGATRESPQRPKDSRQPELGEQYPDVEPQYPYFEQQSPNFEPKHVEETPQEPSILTASGAEGGVTTGAGLQNLVLSCGGR